MLKEATSLNNHPKNTLITVRKCSCFVSRN